MAQDPKQKRWRSVFILGAFFYIWLMVAVIAGALALMASPVTRSYAADGGSLSAAATAGLLLVLAATFLPARWLLRRTLRSRSTTARAAIPAALTLLAILAAWSVVGPGGSIDTLEGPREAGANRTGATIEVVAARPHAETG